jgi:hypothetical protein
MENKMENNQSPLNPTRHFTPSRLGEWRKGLTWIEQYEVIEQQVMGHPELPQEQVAEMLGMTPPAVNSVMKAMRVLNTNSRQMIRENLSNGSQDAAPSND